jgi:hypothetical protein
MKSRSLPLILLSAVPLFSAGAARATVLSSPAVTAQATPFNASFGGANVFDQGSAEYASQGLGVNTFLEFDFGSAQTIDGFVNVTRNNTADVIGNSRLILDTDGIGGFNAATDTVVNFTAAVTGSNGQGYINRFTATTARFARWEVLTSIGTVQNLGAMEMAFMNSPAGSATVAGVTVINAAANPFGANFAQANAANGIAGRGTGPNVEYASNTGTNMFVDFDMGAIAPLTGFDFFDRIALVDHIGSFDLIFSNDPSFATSITTRNYTKGVGGAPGTGLWTHSDSFAPINARYVRFDSTSAAAAGGNLGIGDMVFYQVPEPATAAMFAATGLMLLRRRRA